MKRLRVTDTHAIPTVRGYTLMSERFKAGESVAFMFYGKRRVGRVIRHDSSIVWVMDGDKRRWMSAESLTRVGDRESGNDSPEAD